MNLWVERECQKSVKPEVIKEYRYTERNRFGI
ncbi:MAG: hypothetical protein CM15mP59_6350 [Flavobacteriaceae bacterium]|nr:MAG: hypothetical protein CM15mP59_6350 [Flavobacteriaceae bacterium]